MRRSQLTIRMMLAVVAVAAILCSRYAWVRDSTEAIIEREQSRAVRLERLAREKRAADARSTAPKGDSALAK